MIAPLPLDYPADWKIHGELVCIRANWSSVLIFCLTNYLAHCATVKAHPGETAQEYGIAVALALVLPSSGITRALDSILRRSNLRKMDELGRAAKAGALCMVIRNERWTPNEGDVLPYIVQPKTLNEPQIRETKRSSVGTHVEHDADTPLERDVDPLVANWVSMQDVSREGTRKGDEADAYFPLAKAYRVGIRGELNESIRTSQPDRSIWQRNCKVHGGYYLPLGYDLAYVPSHAAVELCLGDNWNIASPKRKLHERKYYKEFEPYGSREVAIASSYNLVKAAIAIVQTVYASITLYKTRGDQIQTYGYASFGLTVIPYVLMSLLNLFGQIACAEYATLFLVHSDVMDEARRRGGSFDGVIGTLKHVEKKRTAGVELPGPWTVALKPSEGGTRAGFMLRRERDENGIETNEFQIVKEGEAGRDAQVYLPCSSLNTELLDVGPRVEKSLVRRHASTSDFLTIWAPLLFGAISLLIVGLMTRFRKGISTELQRGFTMSWLVVGMLFGSLTRSMAKLMLDSKSVWSAIKRTVGFVLLYGALLVPAIGGLTVVCMMIADYGTCTRIK